MPRSLVLLLVLTLGLTLFAAAGNRADINADQLVNATDSVILQNILAGNLDVGNYDLPAVVVVAKQGGDFTDPADAADWIATQSPSNEHRFIISIAPGDYVLSRSILLPPYTTIRGMDRSECIIDYNAGGNATNYGAAIFCDNIFGADIENLTLNKSSTTTGTTETVVYVRNCTATIRNCNVWINGKGSWSLGIWVRATLSPTSLYLYDTTVDASQPADGSGDCVSIYVNGDSYCEIHTSDIESYNYSSTVVNQAYALYQDVSTQQKMKVFRSTVSAETAGSNPAYYYNRLTEGVGSAFFYFCHIPAGTANYSSSLTLLDCVSDTAVIP